MCWQGIVQCCQLCSNNWQWVCLTGCKQPQEGYLQWWGAVRYEMDVTTLLYWWSITKTMRKITREKFDYFFYERTWNISLKKISLSKKTHIKPNSELNDHYLKKLISNQTVSRMILFKYKILYFYTKLVSLVKKRANGTWYLSLLNNDNWKKFFATYIPFEKCIITILSST